MSRLSDFVISNLKITDLLLVEKREWPRDGKWGLYKAKAKYYREFP